MQKKVQKESYFVLIDIFFNLIFMQFILFLTQKRLVHTIVCLHKPGDFLCDDRVKQQINISLGKSAICKTVLKYKSQSHPILILYYIIGKTYGYVRSNVIVGRTPELQVYTFGKVWVQNHNEIFSADEIMIYNCRKRLKIFANNF